MLIVLADRHPIVLDGLESLFHRNTDVQVCARCADGAEVMAAVGRHRPDVLILDTEMPPTSGLDVVRELRDGGLGTKVVLTARSFREHDVVEALRLGVCGMFLKDLASQLLLQCVRKVHAGAQWLETQISACALGSLVRSQLAQRNGKTELTPREIDVVRMAVGGLPCREMAERLAISQSTVKLHLHNVYRKTRVQNRVELVLYAQAANLV